MAKDLPASDLWGMKIPKEFKTNVLKVETCDMPKGYYLGENIPFLLRTNGNGVYAYFIRNKIVYIGQTRNSFSTRLQQHRLRNLTRVVMICCTEDTDLLALETALIIEHMPKLNKDRFELRDLAERYAVAARDELRIAALTVHFAGSCRTIKNGATYYASTHDERINCKACRRTFPVHKELTPVEDFIAKRVKGIRVPGIYSMQRNGNGSSLTHNTVKE